MRQGSCYLWESAGIAVGGAISFGKSTGYAGGIPDSLEFLVSCAVGPIGARMLGLELQLDSLSILAAAGMGCGIVAVSTLLASVRIFRMEPKEILSMD